MTFDAHKNAADGTVLVAPVPPVSGTSLGVSQAVAELMPEPPFNMPVWAGNETPSATNMTIVRVTAASAPVAGIVTYTIERKTPTEPNNWDRAIQVGDQLMDAATGKTFTDIETAVTGKLSQTANLSDLASAATARTNLGLGTAATQASTAFDAAGAAATAEGKAIASASTLAASAEAGARAASIPLAQKGAASGVPETDANNRIPIARMPLAVLLGPSVDMCRPPYNCVPGEDITQKLGEAIEAITALGGGTVYFSKSGEYLLNGATKEGEVNAHKYNGQVLFPYVATTAPRIPIVIEGCNPVPMESWAASAEPVSTLGVSLVSNLENTLGKNVFSTMAGTAPVSNVEPRFRNIQLGCTAVHPEITMCQFENALAADFTSTRVTVWKASSEITVGGAGYGVRLPKITNAAHATMRDCEVNGFGNGVSHSEHALLDNVAIRRGKVALRPSGGPANIAEYRKVHVKNCTTVIEPEGSGCVLYGSISIEDEVAELVIKDKTNLLTGSLVLRQDKAAGTNTLLPMEGGKNLAITSLAWLPGVYTAAESIAVPATTVAVRNTIFREIEASITTGASTCKVSVNGVEFITLAANTTTVLPWPSGKEITLEYTATPTWKLLVI